MIKRIMVPLDGSKLSEQALPLALSLAESVEAELLLATAVADPKIFGDPKKGDEGVAAERRAAEQYLAAIRGQVTAGGPPIKTAVVSARPHIGISSLCDLEAIDLMVMTTHGRSGVSRWTMGSVADKVLRTTNTPVILIHPATHGTPLNAIKRVVVALDGSELAEAALPLARRLARSVHAPLHLVRAVALPAVIFGAEYLPGALPVLEEMEAEAHGYLKKTAEKLRLDGFETTGVVRTGMPAEVILAEAREPGDMIVISTHVRSGVDRWFLGSVAVLPKSAQPAPGCRPARRENRPETRGRQFR